MSDSREIVSTAHEIILFHYINDEESYEKSYFCFLFIAQFNEYYTDRKMETVY
jgi:hypothetical protein